MADLAELERHLQQLRQANKLKDVALNYLVEADDIQRQRWDLLRQVVDLAGDGYVSKRIDSVEERLRDQGAPLWLSCLLALGVTLVPLSAMAETFLLGLTRSIQKSLTASKRATLNFTEELLGLGYKTSMTAAALRLPEEIIRTELIVSRFAKALAPELGNTLQNAASEIADTIGRQPFKQESGALKLDPIDPPLVAVKRSLHEWINAQVRAESIARAITREEIRDLCDIATSQDPAKSAKEIAVEVAERQAAREPRVPLRTQSGWAQHIPQPNVEKLPKTNKEALDNLTALRDRLAPTAFENSQIPLAKDLRDLQLRIESAIWATTYDFTPRVGRENANRDDPKAKQYWIETKEPAPLPEGLWKRLLERYIDPDERKSYMDAGPLVRLGTIASPAAYSKGKWSPEVRLSHYFSKILYPAINKENGDMVRRFRALKVP